MNLDELPKDIRVKLEEEDDSELWKRISEKGGIKKFSELYDYSASKMYNWKNKDSFYPVEFVIEILGSNLEDIRSFKGASSSKIVEKPDIPLPKDGELLTRVDSSVHVNREGTPVYITDDRALLERFDQLLNRIGDVPTSSYRREQLELRYPSFIHHILQKMIEKGYEKDLPALIDEEGKITEEAIFLPGKKIDLDEFSGTLYSEQKRLELALQKKDEEDIKKIISRQRKRAENLE